MNAKKRPQLMLISCGRFLHSMVLAFIVKRHGTFYLFGSFCQFSDAQRQARTERRCRQRRKVGEAIAQNPVVQPAPQEPGQNTGRPVAQRGGVDENGNFVLGSDVANALNDIAAINDMPTEQQGANSVPIAKDTAKVFPFT